MRLFAILISSAAALVLAACSGAATPKVVFQRSTPIALAAAPVTITLETSRVKKELLAAAANASQSVLLRLDGVAASRQPGVVWKVYLGVIGNDPVFVGNLALYGAGIREGTAHFVPASFAFPVDRAVEIALRGPSNRLRVSFSATGPLVNGNPSRAVPAAPVTIARLSLVIQR